MSGEEKELLARIGQLAGKINRHKNQQAGAVPHTDATPYRRNPYRHATAPYQATGYRTGRRPTTHRHRTLHLNSKPSADAEGAGTGVGSTSSGTAGWVSKTDRHRQLINADIYDKESQNRSKAIEETRMRRLKLKRQREKSRFKDYLQRQASVSRVLAPHEASESNNEILIEGSRFRVMDGGKKLLKLVDDGSATSTTPKSVTVAGVRFNRTKRGNLVANRIVRDHRRSGMVKKSDERCRIFSTTGSCPKGPSCRYQHDPSKVAACKDFLKDGRCAQGEGCDLSHELTAERVPNCLHYAKGHCAKADCPYTHSQAAPGAPVCEAFGFRGYCEKGASCRNRHVFECPDFSNKGSCKTKGCKLLHRERASVLRAKARREEAEAEEDVTSEEEEAGDSDDVDSDEVAEFIEAESDESGMDEEKDFLPI